jgi:hypothetical protein
LRPRCSQRLIDRKDAGLAGGSIQRPSARLVAAALPDRGVREQTRANRQRGPRRRSWASGHVRRRMGRALRGRRKPSSPSPHPSPQPKSDISDFGQLLRVPNSGKPEFGRGEGAHRVRGAGSGSPSRRCITAERAAHGMCSRCRRPHSEQLPHHPFKRLRSLPKPRPPAVAHNLKCERHSSTTMGEPSGRREPRRRARRCAAHSAA